VLISHVFGASCRHLVDHGVHRGIVVRNEEFRVLSAFPDLLKEIQSLGFQAPGVVVKVVMCRYAFWWLLAPIFGSFPVFLFARVSIIIFSSYCEE